MLKYINEGTNTQEDYGYACARIRELEKGLLNQDIINKMIQSSSLESAFKILAESNPNEYMVETITSSVIEKSLVTVLKRTIHMIDEITPYPYLFHLFNWKYDFHNLKVLLKAKLLAKKEPYPTYDIGNIHLNALTAAVFEGKYVLVPIKIERFIRQAEDEYLKSEDLELMEIGLDQGYYEILFNDLENINQPFLDYFYKTEIDLLNISISCRCKVRNISKSKLSNILIKYGHFAPQKMISIYEHAIHSWPNHFQKTDYSSLVESGIKAWLEEKSLVKLERLSDNFLLDLLKIGKFNTFGLESVIGYYYAKENDLKNIRIIFNGKRFMLSIEKIREKVRATYV